MNATVPGSPALNRICTLALANTGQVAGRIEDLPPVADIIKQTWTGHRDVLAATVDRLGPVDDGGTGAGFS